MSAVLEENIEQRDTGLAAPVIVVGTGPVGIRFVEELLQRKPDTPVIIYGNEPWEPYNRVRLTGLLTGELTFAGIQNRLKLAANNHVVQHHNCGIVSIDRSNRRVVDELGRSQPYAKLILATGSRPHIPNIEGIDKEGIFAFRSLNDAQLLLARRARSRRAVVLGGGLLGLEAARGLQKYNTEVFVVEHASRLMAQQLDDEAGELLNEHLLSQGVRVVLGDSVKKVLGEACIKGVALRSGRTIECDTMVIATGIHPNLELARDAGISVGRGVRVNDQMQTSDNDVFAIGECAEHRDRVYGLVSPGLEQAGVAAHHLAGHSSFYVGSQAATRLKVVGVSVFSAGRCGERDAISQLKHLKWRAYDSNGYRKLLLRRNRLVGVIAYGDWDEISRLQEAVQHERYIWPWQQRRFISTGDVWAPRQAASVGEWPAGSVVCQCAHVTRGTLSKAVSAGHCTVEALCEQTGASSVCGSCKPLLVDLVGSQAVEPETGSRTLVWTGLVSLLAAMAMLLAPGIPMSETVQTGIRWDELWRNGLIKQITGFSLLGLGLLISLISVRKRFKSVNFGQFGHWRLVHVLLGILVVGMLIAHTGLRLGYELNLYLMLSFVGLLIAGGVASGVIGLQHILPRALASRTREISMWTHILLIWPLPALLGFHILKGYWF
jgi:nitrite reductase (NADH) large subunit